MGDRANIRLKFNAGTDHEASIYLHSHWGGRTVLGTLHDALSRRQRWDDDAYLARIIANELFHDCYGDETGFGLAPFVGDNQYPVVHVDLDANTVSTSLGFSETFEQFISEPMTEARAQAIMPYGKRD